MPHVFVDAQGDEPAAEDVEEEEAPHVAGMESTTPALAEKAEREAVERRAREAANALDAPIGDERMRAFKDKARRDIETRLLAQRKKRKLMRGGDLP